MNCPAKTDPIIGDGHNQSPNALCADLTTRSDLGRVANARIQREHRLGDHVTPNDVEIIPQQPVSDVDLENGQLDGRDTVLAPENKEKSELASTHNAEMTTSQGVTRQSIWQEWSGNTMRVARTYCKFIGPGFMVSVVCISHRRSQSVAGVLTCVRHISIPGTTQPT